MSEYRGIAKWSNEAVGMINWNDQTNEGTAQVTDETTGTVYEIGGGGESDFSTAEVTFLNSLGEGERDPYTFTGSVVSDEADGEGIVANTFEIQRNETTVFKIPLYKGTYYMSILSLKLLSDDVMPELSGNIEMDVPNMSYVITGDCSINAAGYAGN